MSLSSSSLGERKDRTNWKSDQSSLVINQHEIGKKHMHKLLDILADFHTFSKPYYSEIITNWNLTIWLLIEIDFAQKGGEYPTRSQLRILNSQSKEIEGGLRTDDPTSFSPSVRLIQISGY